MSLSKWIKKITAGYVEFEDGERIPLNPPFRKGDLLGGCALKTVYE